MLFSFGRKHGFIPIACLSASLSAALRRAPEVGVKGVAAVAVPAVALVTAHLPVLWRSRSAAVPGPGLRPAKPYKLLQHSPQEKCKDEASWECKVWQCDQWGHEMTRCCNFSQTIPSPYQSKGLTFGIKLWWCFCGRLRPRMSTHQGSRNLGVISASFRLGILICKKIPRQRLGNAIPSHTDPASGGPSHWEQPTKALQEIPTTFSWNHPSPETPSPKASEDRRKPTELVPPNL